MVKNKKVFVDVHVLQTVPPSCINRDDTGSPKTAIYGGTTRARVSSQAWKRAMRAKFNDGIFNQNELGCRTKYLYNLIVDDLKQNKVSIDELMEKNIDTVLKQAKITLDKCKVCKALFFVDKGHIAELRELLVSLSDKKLDLNKESKGKKNSLKDELSRVKEIFLSSATSVDIVLFGRMLAENPSLNVDATAQVAHAISTHTIRNEYDYFTAIDDAQPEDKTGAAFLDTTEYNSATYYRYATVDVAKLYDHYKEDTDRIVAGFIEAFVKSMPTGRQNSFANGTIPDLVYVTVRTDQPVNLVVAFEKPVWKSEGGYLSNSEKALAEYADKLYSKYDCLPEKSFVLSMNDEIANHFNAVNMDNLGTLLEQTGKAAMDVMVGSDE